MMPSTKFFGFSHSREVGFFGANRSPETPPTKGYSTVFPVVLSIVNLVGLSPVGIGTGHLHGCENLRAGRARMRHDHVLIFRSFCISM